MTLFLTLSGRSWLHLLIGAAFSLLFLSSDLVGREAFASSKEEALRAYQVQHQTMSTAVEPVQYIAQSRGNMQLALANNGTFGTYGQELADPFTGLVIPSCIYPKNSSLVYVWVGAFWIGAVVGEDTLVSCGTEDFYETLEFQPDLPPCDDEFQKNGFCYYSIDEQHDDFNTQAFAAQAFI